MQHLKYNLKMHAIKIGSMDFVHTQISSLVMNEYFYVFSVLHLYNTLFAFLVKCVQDGSFGY